MFVQTEKSAADEQWVYRGKVFVTKGLKASNNRGSVVLAYPKGAVLPPMSS